MRCGVRRCRTGRGRRKAWERVERRRVRGRGGVGEVAVIERRRVRERGSGGPLAAGGPVAPVIDRLRVGKYNASMRTETKQPSGEGQVSLNTVIIAVGAAQFMLPFMLSGAGPLLPAIGRDLHASAMQLSLINAAYTLSLAIFHLVSGRVGDMIGRKRLFLGGLSLFVVVSALLPFVTDIWVFLGLRFVQAMGTAIMNTCALAILASCAPPEQLGRVLGLTSIGVYSGLSLGPGLSGILGTALGWQFLFFSVVPIGVIAWLLMYCNVRRDWKDAPDDPFDWRGSLFYTMAISSLSIGAIWLLDGAWAGVLFVFGLLFLGMFLWSERHSAHPILDIAFLVRNRPFALSTLASFINYSSIFGVTFYFSLYLQGVHGLTLLQTGLLLSAQPAIQVFVSPFGGRMADRHGADVIATIGIAVCGVGLLMASSLDGDSTLWVVTAVQLVIGSGIALFASPNTSAIMTSVDEAHRGQASGLVGTARTLGTLSSMVIISLTMNAYLGDESLGPSNVPDFLSAMHVNFALFGVLNLLGIFCSIGRMGGRSGIARRLFRSWNHH